MLSLVRREAPMIDVYALPALNALLNLTAAVLLSCGYVMIRSRRVPLHRAAMLSAFVASTLFLVSYVVYHARVGSHPFTGHGPVRALYFAILITHVVLAATIVPLSLVTLARALRGRYALHRRIARWTLPLWLYVSVTGVVIYLMLYR
jgi:uncharacterized membrane protein YozB (DUF420 family)